MGYIMDEECFNCVLHPTSLFPEVKGFQAPPLNTSVLVTLLHLVFTNLLQALENVTPLLREDSEATSSK